MTMPLVREVKANGISLAVYDTGTVTDRLPVIFCHGFPELAYSWRHQLDALAKSGRRAIAPDMRGYGGSSQPDEIEAYDIAHLTGDLAGLLDALDLEKAVFCGHDWGGVVVWQMALRHPERVAGVIGVNTPFQPRPATDPIETLMAAFGPDMYMLWFQQPGIADRAFDADPERAIRFFMRLPSQSLSDYLRRPASERTLALGKSFERYDPKTDPLQFLADTDIAHYAAAFARTGFTGGLNWYRNLSRNWRLSDGLAERISVPCLMIMAENDVVLRPSMTRGMENHISDLERYLVPGSGHWTQQEHPDEVSRVVVDWVDRRFSLRSVT